METQTHDVACEICGENLKISAYGDGTCPKCGARYSWEEGYCISLTDQQKLILKAAATMVDPTPKVRQG